MEILSRLLNSPHPPPIAVFGMDRLARMVQNSPTLPVGTQRFSALRQANEIYVDKTELIYQLAGPGRGQILLVRPRRFGKSLLVSTLESLFKFGVRDFKDLAIEKLWTDRQYPVVRLDFSEVREFVDAAEFARKFHEYLVKRFSREGFAFSENAGSVISQLSDWLDGLDDNSLVLLIDEYDAPLTASLHDGELFEAVRSIMSEFYLTLKSVSGSLRFLFVTGITKFSSTSVFSAFNSLRDISLEPKFGTLLGYTEEEIVQNFGSFLEAATQIIGLNRSELMTELRANYNGFCFDQLAKTHVYCPWSVLKFLEVPDLGFQNYWYASGGRPTVLKKYLAGHPLEDPGSFDKPVNLRIDALSAPRSYDEISTEVLLAQTGYLTIKKRLSSVHLQLGYPNKEVYESMGRLYADELLRSQTGQDCGLEYWTGWLESGRIDEIVASFNSVFNGIDYARYPVNDEASCRSHLQMLLIGAGLSPVPESHSALGRSDLEVEAAGRLWVFEIKYAREPSEEQKLLQEGMEQMRARRYGEKLHSKKLMRAVLVFSASKRKFSAWQLDEP